MPLRVFTIRFDPSVGAFDDSELHDFTRLCSLHAVYEHFAVVDGSPVLVVMVHYREPAGLHELPRGREPEARPGSSRSGRRGPDLLVTDPALPIYEALRQWRNERAKALGVPPYAIGDNRILVAIAEGRPASLAELQSIRGVGDAKIRDFGPDILQLVAAAIASPVSHTNTPEG